jgi:hypothetical protein
LRAENAAAFTCLLETPWTWAVVPAGCDGVLIDNVKICGSRVLNDVTFENVRRFGNPVT